MKLSNYLLVYESNRLKAANILNIVAYNFSPEITVVSSFHINTSCRSF
jgi:hypothetical protein